MVVDNDVYVRLDNLTSVLRSTSMSNVQKFFAGQVWQIQYGRPLRPQRDIDLKNYLPWKLWPSRDFPPVAIGPHYLMSRDCVEFLTYNKLSLRGVGKKKKKRNTKKNYVKKFFNLSFLFPI